MAVIANDCQLTEEYALKYDPSYQESTVKTETASLPAKVMVTTYQTVLYRNPKNTIFSRLPVFIVHIYYSPVHT